MQKLSQVSKKYIFWLVLFLSAFIPAYPKFPLINVPGTYVAIRIEDILIAITTVVFGLAILPNIKGYFKSSISQSFFTFWVVGLVSLFSGIFLTQSVIWHLGFLNWLRRVEVMILFFMAWYAFRNLKQVRIWLMVMLGITTFIIFYGFGQQLLHFPVISTTNREFSKGLILYLTPDARINSTFAGHYDLAAYLAMFLTFASAGFLFFKGFLKRAVIILISILAFILLALTAARVSFVGAVVGILTVFILSGNKKLILLLMAAVVLAFVISPELRHRTVATITVNLLGGGGPKYTITPAQLAQSSASGQFSSQLATGSASVSGVPVDIAPGEPINTTELGVYRSFDIRYNEEWPRAIRAFEKNPLLGTGYSSLTIATDNDYLRSLGETGILGTLAFALVFLVLAKSMWRYLRTQKKTLGYFVVLGLFSMTIGFLINGVFIDVFESSKVASLFWLSMGVGFAIIRMDRTEV